MGLTQIPTFGVQDVPPDIRRQLLGQSLLGFGAGALRGAATGDATNTVDALERSIASFGAGAERFEEQRRDLAADARAERGLDLQDRYQSGILSDRQEDRRLATEERAQILEEREGAREGLNAEGSGLAALIQERINDPEDPRSSNAQFLAQLGTRDSVESLRGILEELTDEQTLPGRVSLEAELRRQEVLKDIAAGAARSPNAPPPRNPQDTSPLSRLGPASILSDLRQRSAQLEEMAVGKLGLNMNDFERQVAGLPPIKPQTRERLRVEARQRAQASAKSELSSLLGRDVESLLSQAVGLAGPESGSGGAAADPAGPKLTNLDHLPDETIATALVGQLSASQIRPGQLRSFLEHRLSDPTRVEAILAQVAAAQRGSRGPSGGKRWR